MGHLSDLMGPSIGNLRSGARQIPAADEHGGGRPGIDVGRVPSHCRDACGRAHPALDYDPTTIALRKRGLPYAPDLPEPIARATAIAAPGCKGRKRGEVQIAAHALCHAGTGTWCHLEYEAGNPHPA